MHWAHTICRSWDLGGGAEILPPPRVNLRSRDPGWIGLIIIYIMYYRIKTLKRHSIIVPLLKLKYIFPPPPKAQSWLAAFKIFVFWYMNSWVILNKGEWNNIFRKFLTLLSDNFETIIRGLYFGAFLQKGKCCITCLTFIMGEGGPKNLFFLENMWFFPLAP